MMKRIDLDVNRFKKMLRGKIRKDLKKYVTQHELIGRRGRELVSIPVSQIHIPQFRLDPQKANRVDQGDGEDGSPIAISSADGNGHAGNAPGEHIIEVELTLDELAKILGEELELPNIQPKGKNTIQTARNRYTGIRNTGPESLRHFKRTYKAALKRQIISRMYDSKTPIVIPYREERRYRSWEEKPLPESNAVVIYMMDVSGSMGDEQKEIVRTEAFWIDSWLKYQYKSVEVRYIVHDAVAHEVDSHTFFHTMEIGGTIISSAYRLCYQILKKDYDPDEWNIYLFHFSDGDNWGEIDTRECFDLLEDVLLPRANLFCYGQVESPYGSGQFLHDLREHFTDQDTLVLSEIPDKEAIYDSIKLFLGKGK
ncbi:DUF444 family protein [candidate division KSB1 bacterium]|nr:DUF444 family protein [candidate division KSB1 bacterium]